MSDILSVSVQDFLHGRKSELREGKIGIFRAIGYLIKIRKIQAGSACGA